MAVKQNLVPPDIFRLRYRQALSDVVAAIVQNDEATTIATVNARLPSSVAAPDPAQFTQLVLPEFAALHPGMRCVLASDPWRLPRGCKGMGGEVCRHVSADVQGIARHLLHI